MHRTSLAAVVLLVAACHSSKRPPAAGGDLELDEKGKAEHVDDGPAKPKEIVVPADAPAGKIAVINEAQDAVEVFDIGAGALPRQITTTPLTDVDQLVWTDPAQPVRVLRQGELGRIDAAGAYAANKVPGKGELTGMIVDASGQLWLNRCEKWGEDNPEEEGCLRRAYHPLPPGKATKKAKKAPALRKRTDGAPAPAKPVLSAKDGALLCDDKTIADDQIIGTPTWEWLSTEPPIAVARIEYAGSGEGETMPDETQPYLVRGCTLEEESAFLRRGPDGLWAVRVDGEWQISWQGTLIGKLPGYDLVFAAGQRD